MNIQTLYGVVVKSSDGGENMDSYLIRNSALNRSRKIIDAIKNSSQKGFKVYLSELEYDEYKNIILSGSLINEDSELLFEN